MRYCAFLVLLLAAVSEARVNKIRRVKRDDGSYLADSGGPVAQSSGPGEGGGGGGEGGGGGMEECEISFAKVLNHALGTATDLASNAANATANAALHPVETAGSLLSAGAGAASSVFETGKSAAGTALTAGKDAASSVVSGGAAVLSGGLDLATNPSKVKDQLASWALYPKELFDKFVKTYNKTYATPSDVTAALASFTSNLAELTKLVLGRFSPFDAAFVITEFMDLKFDDFVAHYTGAVLEQADAVLDKIDAALIQKRECKTLNWTSLDVVPEVRRQDKCGCCYAMSTSDMIAAQQNIDAKKYHSRFSLSPQWLLNCIEPPAALGCKGGRPVKVLENLKKFTKWNNIPLEECYPYEDKETTCKKTVACPKAPDVQVRWGKMVDISGDKEMETMAALLQHGPVVAIVAVTQAWQMYNGTGILRARQCSDKQNHAVLITGYDYSTCVPSYTIKNSWGTKWGGRGYIKLEAGKNTCAVAKSIVFTCTGDDCEGQDPLKYALSKSKHPDCQK